MQRALLAVMGLLIGAGTAGAQPPSRFDAEGGIGYVFGGGIENPGPSLPGINAGAAVWWTDRWGLAARVVYGPGEDLTAAYVRPGGTILGIGDLRYLAVTLRRRAPVARAWRLELGAGMMLFGRFSMVQMLDDPPRRLSSPAVFFDGFSLEALATRTLSGALALKAGLTYDFNFETNHVQPVVLASLRF